MSQIQSIGDVQSMVRRRAVLIVAVLILGTGASVFWALSQPRIYEATAVAQIESPAVRDSAIVAAVPGTTSSADHRLRILEQKLMARDNLMRLVEKYDLYSKTDLSPGLKVATLRENTRITQITDPTAAFGAVQVPTGMNIAVMDAKPEIAAALANDFLKQLVTLNHERRAQAAQKNLEFFQAEASRIETEILALEAEIASFKEDNAPFMPDGIRAQRDELGTLKTSLLELEQKLIELDADRNRLRAEVVERQSLLLKGQQTLIQKRIDEINANIAGAPEVDREFGNLNRQLEQRKEQYAVITRRATEAEMGQQLTSQDQFERVEILESALVPENPVSGSRKKKIALGAFLSGVLGVGIAFLAESMSPVIRTSAQLERALGVKPVVAIPKLTTTQDKRRRRTVWAAVIAVILAVIAGGWFALKEAGIKLSGLFAGRMSKA